VVVANNSAYGGGMYVAPEAQLDDGEFDVVTIARVGKLRFLSNLPKVFKGTHVRNDEVQVVRAARLRVSASRPFAVYADGEHLTDLPADLRVIPSALRVLVPGTAA
jgi:diacylglycerol kinase family enzyme